MHPSWNHVPPATSIANNGRCGLRTAATEIDVNVQTMSR